ncbi:hypothetical protein QWY31_08690 [Cytophagales bacterium LB-30]|uniref:Protein SirB1 N-terminal domain-containing protein n=1 Tax=Shiella aurantiaca TaxID=3058365 RepID=A0ABT8F6H7_9BACT|nr:hypothetical protein [Shiella aurantiaca]MDN4165576.1 hypothetical protein [Shiella aurantiaca]
MRLVTCLFIISLLSLSTQAQDNEWASISFASETEKQAFESASGDYLGVQLAMNGAASQAEIQEWKNQLTAFATTLKEKFSLPERKFLAYVFYQTHKVFLHQYAQETHLADVFSQGKYNCLSASLLYAHLLNELGLGYEFIESPHHIVVLVKGKEQTYLFESTDASNGFVFKPEQVKKRIQSISAVNNPIQSPSLIGTSTSNEYIFTTDETFTIGMKEATGLLFYNQAIVEYNAQKLDASFMTLYKGLYFYSSPRMQEFFQVLVQTINQAPSLGENTRQQLIHKYAQYKAQLK